MLIFTRTMKDRLTILKPHFQQSKFVDESVQGYLHEVRKKIRWYDDGGPESKILDIGTHKSHVKFGEAVWGNDANIAAVSVLPAATIQTMQTVVVARKGANLSDDVKVMKGGGPVTDSNIGQIGADDLVSDASSAVSIAKSRL
jgi:methanogenic corrinoid protein MtbC1